MRSRSQIGIAPLLIVISGPSGVGKDAILNRMKACGCPFEFIVTATTRSRRAAEKNGIDYQFLSVSRFQGMIKGNELLEYASVYSNWYGVPKQAVRVALERGLDTIVKVDVQGAASIKKIVPEAVFVFIAPPSLEELLNRLIQRRTETQFDLDKRTQAASDEMKQLSLFDYVVVNQHDGIDAAIAQIQAIVTAEKCRVKPRRISL